MGKNLSDCWIDSLVDVAIGIGDIIIDDDVGKKVYQI